MSWIGKQWKRLKDAVFGTPKDDGPSKAEERRAFEPYGAGRRLDQGPATRKYVKACFPRSLFTKKRSAWHEWHIRRIMKRLRPEQREIARRYGYTKGMDV